MVQNVTKNSPPKVALQRVVLQKVTNKKIPPNKAVVPRVSNNEKQKQIKQKKCKSNHYIFTSSYKDETDKNYCKYGCDLFQVK